MKVGLYQGWVLAGQVGFLGFGLVPIDFYYSLGQILIIEATLMASLWVHSQ